MSKPVYQLTNKDIKEANFRFLWVSIACFNYGTQLGPSVVWGISKALRKLYPEDEDYKAALLNHSKYYNSQPYMGSLIIGAALGMEQELGIEGKDAIQDFKAGLMGPTTGIGDSIFWIMMPAIFTPIAASMAYDGSLVGWLIECVYWIILHCFRMRFFGWGFKMGGNFVSVIKDQLPLVTDAVGILGLTVLGALIPSTIGITCPVVLDLGNDNIVNIQSLLDTLLPNFLAVLSTFIAAKLLRGRKLTMTQLVLAVLAISILLSALGIIA